MCIIAVLQSWWTLKSWKSIWCIKYRMFNIDEQTNWRILKNVYMISCKWELSSDRSAYLRYIIGFYIKIKITLFYKKAMDNLNASRIVIWSENIMSIIIPSLSEVCHYWSRFIRLTPYMPGRISYHFIFHCHSKKRRLL